MKALKRLKNMTTSRSGEVTKKKNSKISKVSSETKTSSKVKSQPPKKEKNLVTSQVPSVTKKVSKAKSPKKKSLVTSQVPSVTKKVTKSPKKKSLVTSQPQNVTRKKTKTKAQSPKKTGKLGVSIVSKKTKANSNSIITKRKPIRRSAVSKLSLRKKALRENQHTLNSKILKPRRRRDPKKQIDNTRGVVYLKNIPHGFYETELKNFFNQFGQVTAVRVPRSTRTGKFKGYAFVEFLYSDVAKIAAETMNNYLMYKKIVKAKFIPPEEQKPLAMRFKTAQVPLTVRRKRFLRQRSNRILTEKQSEQEKKRLDDAVQKKLNKLKKLGINYEFQVANKENTN